MPDLIRNRPIRLARELLLLAGVVLAVPSTAFSHQGKPIGPEDFWTAWQFQPGIVISLGIAAWLYGRGLHAQHRASANRLVIPQWQAACFVAGWISLFVALVSPLHPLGEALFSAHMAQHELLMLVAAPLLALARPLVVFLWGLPVEWRRRLGRFAKQRWFQWSWHTLTNPVIAWCVQALALWAWHDPQAYQATLRSDVVHTAQHLSFLGSAALFWWALIYGREGRMGYGAATFYVFTTAAHSSALGALLTFAPGVWYPVYSSSTASWGVTGLQDQQIAGLIMWVPAGVIYLIAGVALFAAWLLASDPAAPSRGQDLTWSKEAFSSGS